MGWFDTYRSPSFSGGCLRRAALHRLCLVPPCFVTLSPSCLIGGRHLKGGVTRNNQSLLQSLLPPLRPNITTEVLQPFPPPGSNRCWCAPRKINCICAQEDTPEEVVQVWILALLEFADLLAVREVLTTDRSGIGSAGREAKWSKWIERSGEERSGSKMNPPQRRGR